ncbi:MAG TPA: hypothetical protein VG692_13520 [Gemmatimonadales bacterium]|nr:hypothetical protein [Gemmatimonadales bacterium]
MPIMRLVVLALTLPATLTAQATTRIPIETGKGLGRHDRGRRHRAPGHGTRADFYVNGASQPALVVTDMKDSTRAGGIALWIGRGTLAYFSNLRVTPAPH